LSQDLNVQPWVRCLLCGAPITVIDEYFANYFSGVTVTCPDCSGSIDWWGQVLREIQDNFMGSMAFSAIGAESTIVKIVLNPGQRTVIQFADHGVPEDAKLLHVNYTPSGGGLFPIEIHGNVPHRLLRHEVTLWPMQLGGPTTGRTEVNVFVTWVQYPNDAYALERLGTAFEAYSDGRYSDVLVPANVAVELSLYKLLANNLEPVIGKGRTEEFLENGASYNHQLNGLLPFLTSTQGYNRLPEHVRGLLNRLRRLRNQVAHKGVLEDSLEKTEAAELLCAALFGVHYTRWISPS